MQEKKLTEKMLIELVNKLPKPIVNYWIENSAKPNDCLLSYAMGFFDGENFVLETIVKPHIDKVDKILHP